MSFIRETDLGMYSEQTVKGRQELKANANAAVSALETATARQANAENVVIEAQRALEKADANGIEGATKNLKDAKGNQTKALVTQEEFAAGEQGRYDLRIAPNWSDARFLSTLSGAFDSGVTQLKKKLNQAFHTVTHNASDPAALAAYQAALAEYTLYRNAQSNAVKAYKDVDANTIRNFN